MESLKQKIVEIITNRDKTPVEQADEILLLVGVMPRFIVTFKNDGNKKELFWETTAKTDGDAVDLFWKTHDVLCELISVNKI